MVLLSLPMALNRCQRASPLIERLSTWQKIARVLRSVYKKSGARSRNVAVAVSGSSIISNYIDVPSSLTSKQVEARVKLEADTIIPFPLDEINLDFAVVGQNITSKDQVRVQVVACQRDYVDRRKEVVELAALNPVVVDIESFAFARAYQTLRSVPRL